MSSILHLQEMRQDREGCADLADYAQESTVRIFGALVAQADRHGSILSEELLYFHL